MSDHLAPGTLLLSAPRLRDPNFMHTVVLMCQHDENGAYGLVVNRLANVSIGELLPEHPSLGGLELPVQGGGPVGLDTLQILHRVPDAIPGGSEIAMGVFLGGELNAVARFATEMIDPREKLRFVVGYSGWGEGQLEEELATGSWVPAPFEPRLAFAEDDAEIVWRAALRGLGDQGQGLAQMPPDPSWN